MTGPRMSAAMTRACGFTSMYRKDRRGKSRAQARKVLMGWYDCERVFA